MHGVRHKNNQFQVIYRILFGRIQNTNRVFGPALIVRCTSCRCCRWLILWCWSRCYRYSACRIWSNTPAGTLPTTTTATRSLLCTFCRSYSSYRPRPSGWRFWSESIVISQSVCRTRQVNLGRLLNMYVSYSVFFRRRRQWRNFSYFNIRWRDENCDDNLSNFVTNTATKITCKRDENYNVYFVISSTSANVRSP